MAQVFFSYSREDLSRVTPLVEALLQEGYCVWWDRILQPGENFEAIIDREIQQAQCIVVAWTVHSVNSQWVKNEAMEGVDRNILVPVALDDVRLPVAFKQHQSANFHTWPETVDEKEYQRLIQAMDRILAQDNLAPRATYKGIEHMKSRGRRHYRRRRDVMLPIALIASLAAVALFILATDTPESRPQTMAPRLAVTPFTASDDDESQFYADSMTQQIVQHFGEFDDLELVQVSSGWNLDLIPLSQTILQRESDFVLTAKVTIANDSLDIRASLNQPTANTQLWQANYRDTSDNLFELQRKLVIGVINQLNLVTARELGTVKLAQITRVPDAYKDYLRGLDLLPRGEQHQISRAIMLFEFATAKDPAFASAFAAMCRAYLERYRISNAAVEFALGQKNCQQAQAMNEQLEDVHLARAELYLTRGELDLARYHYTKTLELAPRSADAAMGLAQVFTREADLQSAEKLFLKATQLRPTYWKAQKALGNFYFRQGLYFQAIESYQRVTQLTTANATAFNNLGAAQFHAGYFDAASESWNQASQYSTNSAAFSNAGTALYYAGRFYEALRHFETALKMDRNDHRLWGNIGDNVRFIDNSAHGPRTNPGR